MLTLGIVASKGGAHKSGLGIGLAVAATLAGYKAVVIDLDPQATASRWHDRRAEEEPTVVSAQSSRLGPVLAACAKGGIDFAILDTDGRNSSCALDAIRVSDLVLIPTRPNIVEVETISTVKDMLVLGGNPKAFVVLNSIQPAATRQADDAREMITKLFGLPCCPTHLCARQIYARAPETGQSPQETEPDGRAAVELQNVFQFVCQTIGLMDRQNGKKKLVRNAA